MKKSDSSSRSPKAARKPPPDEVDLDTEVVLDGRGRRITESDAERIAAETLVQLGRGRPSLTGRATHSPRVSLRITDEVARKLDEVAAREGKTRSEIARAALEKYVS